MIQTTVKKIKKRDGRIMKFDQEKVITAIFKAAQSVGGSDKELAEKLSDQVVALLEEKYDGHATPTVEEVQDFVEKVLIEAGHAQTAKAYIIYRQKRANIRKAKSLLGVEDDIKLTLNAIKVLEKRYLKKDLEGNISETPKEMFRRVAKNIASADAKFKAPEAEVKKTEKEFYNSMTRLEFMPNSPTLMNAGRDLQQLSACFVLPIDDDMESIFDTLKSTALIHKSGGGTGFAFSRLRQSGARVKSTSGVASGPISFMKVFNAATEVIKQGGTRRGANMAILRVDHPDILNFIVAKERETSLNNFNISVGVTEKFMKAVDNESDYELIDPMTKKPIGKLNAKRVFDLIVTMAWKNGEPGIVFLDRLNKDNPTPEVGQIESTNPCIVGDSLVSTEHGLVRMKDVAERFKEGGLGIQTDNRVMATQLGLATDGGELGTTRHLISQAFETGFKETVKVTTRAGYELELTPDHKMMTTVGWVKAGDLSTEHKVLIQSSDYLDKAQVHEDEVVSIAPNGKKLVYDLTEPVTHSFIANGIIIANCGEQPLLPYESCNLGSINLSKMLSYHDGEAKIDYPKLRKTVHMAVHFLDNVIEMNKYPLPQIDKTTRSNRKVGLGAMGFADMLIMLGIPYNSEEAIRAAEEVMKFIHDEGVLMSQELAKTRGSFPNFKKSIFKDGPAMRNATITTIAPTGTISIISGCSSGVEPLFAVSYVRRNILDTGDELIEVNPLFEKVAYDRQFYSDELMRNIAAKGSLHGVEEIPQDVRDVFVTAHDIKPADHVKMQAAFQKYTDNAVSKTVNFPSNATTFEVDEVYRLAYKLGCKGVTIYRDQSRTEQVLNIVGEKKKCDECAEE